MKLTLKQRQFAEEFAKTGDLLGAYAAAGYSVKHKEMAYKNASALKNKKEVNEYLKELFARIADESIITRKEILQILSSIIRGQTKERRVVVVGTGEGCSHAEIIDVKPSHADITKAMKLFCEMTGGLYIDEKAEDAKSNQIVFVDDLNDE